MLHRSKLSRPAKLHKPRFYVSGGRRRSLAGLLAVLVSGLAACAGHPPMLNSERIEAIYGSYGIEVLEANGSRRVTNLYSEEHGLRTTRTHADVRFLVPVDDALRAEHAIILAGGSIGQVLESRGWTVSKRDLRITTVRLDDSSGRDIARLMRIAVPSEVALHEYVLVASRESRNIEYAVITERHHPHYLTEADVRRIYGKIAKSAK